MQLKFLYLLLLSSLSVFSQKEKSKDTIKIKIQPSVATRVVLYAAKGAQQKYISYVDATNGIFNLPVPKNLKKGMYRLVYNQKTMEYLDFLYFGKDLSFQFNPEKPLEAPIFKNSALNTTYFTKLKVFREQQQTLDSLQVAYFKTQEKPILKSIEKAYKKQAKLLDKSLHNFLEKEDNTLVKDLVKATIQVKPKQPMADPDAYLSFIKTHYFDVIDFNNKHLIGSSILIDKAMDYVFYLNISNTTIAQNKIYKKAVATLLPKIKNPIVRKGFIKALLQSFAKEENIVLTDYLFAQFYDKLPLEIQDKQYVKSLQQELRTAVGRTAPDFKWKENKKFIKLSDLKGFDTYILAFWSSSCPHCLKEMPKLYEYAKDKKNTKVILIGLQTEEDKGAWKSETYYYPDFTHVLALDKWENPIVRSYNVHATPSYFVLNADKKIINKPYGLTDLKVFFKSLK